MLKQTSSQTIGPFFSFSLVCGSENTLVEERTAGERITIEGRVLDGNGEPVLDALVEIWQPDANGIFNHPADPRQAQADPYFRGFGRSETTDGGRFWFRTIKPGRLAAADGRPPAPHINVRVFARGMLIHAVTRIYFADEENANAADPVLAGLPDPARRQTLIARHETSPEGLPRYCFDIILQGADETVFFDP